MSENRPYCSEGGKALEISAFLPRPATAPAAAIGGQVLWRPYGSLRKRTKRGRTDHHDGPIARQQRSLSKRSPRGANRETSTFGGKSRTRGRVRPSECPQIHISAVQEPPAHQTRNMVNSMRGSAVVARPAVTVAAHCRTMSREGDLSGAKRRRPKAYRRDSA